MDDIHSLHLSSPFPSFLSSSLSVLFPFLLLPSLSSLSLRVQPGHCFYLFTSYQYSKLNEFQLPEMLRTPLEELVLQIKILRLGMAEPFLSKALEAPKKKSVQDAVQLLKNLVRPHSLNTYLVI